MTPESNPAPHSLALRPRAAAQALNISERLLWQLTNAGMVPCVKLGCGKRKTVLYPVPVLEAWLAQQAAASQEGQK
jgi:hypothetical protein